MEIHYHHYGWFPAILACFSLLFISLIWWNFKTTKNFPPGPFGIPLIGYTLSSEPFKDLFHLGKLYGNENNKVISIRLGRDLVVVLNSYEAIHEAMVMKACHFSGRPATFTNKFNKGKGIVASSGPLWKEQRTFFMKTLKQFGVGTKHMEEKIQSELGTLLQRVAAFAENGKYFNIKPLLMNSVANIACSISVGKKYDLDDPEFVRLVSSMETFFQESGSVSSRHYTPYIIKLLLVKFSTRIKRLQASFTNMYTYANNIKNQLKSEFDGDKVKHYVDAFFKENQKESSLNTTFADEDYLTNTIVTMFTAGTDTVTTTLTWIILYMVLYPNVQTRVQEELDKAIENKRYPALSDEPNLPYTCAVIREVQRIAVVAPMSLLHATTDDTSLFGYEIPRGTNVISNLWAVMHDPDNWLDPEIFKPERFLDENGKLLSFQNMIPFGSGRRKCPGENMAKMEVFLITTSLLHFYSFHLSPEYILSSDDLIKGKSGLVFCPRPFEVMATLRK